MDSSETQETGFAPVNGIDLYYEVKGTGKPVLFIHSGICDSSMWNVQFEEFSESYQAIRCDLRGFGRSRAVPGVFTYYQDIAALLEYLKISPVTLIASSFGGSIAIDFALVYSDRVNALVLVSPAIGGYEFTSDEMLDFFSKEEEALARDDPAGATEANLVMWVDGFKRSKNEVNQDVRNKVRAMQLDIFSQPEPIGSEELDLMPPAIDQLENITAPTLLITGDKDAAEFQHIATTITDRIKNSDHAVINGTAHLPSMEKPEDFNRIVLDFIRKTVPD